MATLLELKTRIQLETKKDDIASGGESETALTTAITQAIAFYSDRQFWFNRGSGYRTTTPASATIDMPSGVRYPDTVVYSGEALLDTSLEAIEYRTETGIPSRWAENEGSIQLWPIPDAAYTIYVYGLASTGIPATDGDSNIWTTEAYDLIAARTRYLLFRDLWRDTEGWQAETMTMAEELSRLMRETRRRGQQTLRSTGTEPWGARTVFDINRGDF